MLKRFLNEAQSNPQIASGFKQKLGITSPRPPQGMPMPKLFGNAMPGPRPPMPPPMGPPPQGGMMPPPPPQGMPMRLPMNANKARGTLFSHTRTPLQF